MNQTRGSSTIPRGPLLTRHALSGASLMRDQERTKGDNHRGTRSVGCCPLSTQLGASSGLIPTKALGSQVVPVLGTAGCTGTPARYQTVSGGAKYRFASGS